MNITNEKKREYALAITLDDSVEVAEYAEMLKREYDLSKDEIAKLKGGYLFLISDNIRYGMFDADAILYDKNKESYYHTGNFNPINEVANENIVALVDDNGECEAI